MQIRPHLAWLETASDTFVARHDERDAPDVERVLARSSMRARGSTSASPSGSGELAVVVHGSAAQLDAAEPWLPLQRRLTAPAGRRYLVGWAAERELHVLAPRLLAQRASNVEGSLELLMLAPAALLARRYVAANHPGMPPPFGPRTLRALAALGVAARGRGAVLLRPDRATCARRSRGGCARAARPRSRPGGATRRCSAAPCSTCWRARRATGRCVALACGPHRDGARAALTRAFDGRDIRHTEAAWRSHLVRLGEPGGLQTRRAR